jgi:hypothetical protein
LFSYTLKIQYLIIFSGCTPFNLSCRLHVLKIVWKFWFETGKNAGQSQSNTHNQQLPNGYDNVSITITVIPLTNSFWHYGVSSGMLVVMPFIVCYVTELRRLCVQGSRPVLSFHPVSIGIC